MPTDVTITLRNQEYKSTLTESDGVLFLSVLFNDEEIAALEAGKSEVGIAMFQRRQVQKMEEELAAASSEEEIQKVNDKYNRKVSEIIFQRIERDPSTRSIIASRIKECFRDIPDNMVYWDSKREFGIRLEPEETMSLFMQIIEPVLGKNEKLKAAVAANNAAQTTEIPPDTSSEKIVTVDSTAVNVEGETRGTEDSEKEPLLQKDTDMAMARAMSATDYEEKIKAERIAHLKSEIAALTKT